MTTFIGFVLAHVCMYTRFCYQFFLGDHPELVSLRKLLKNAMLHKEPRSDQTEWHWHWSSWHNKVRLYCCLSPQSQTQSHVLLVASSFNVLIMCVSSFQRFHASYHDLSESTCMQNLCTHASFCLFGGLQMDCLKFLELRADMEGTPVD